MKPYTSLLFLCLICVGHVYGQNIDDENNWYKETERGDNWYTKFDYRRYSKEDVLIAKVKYLHIVRRRDLNEWEGDYRQGTMLGTAELTWSARAGYVLAYTYHTLAILDYGKAFSSNEYVWFRSEKPRQDSGPEKLVKVKFGNTHFLVPQNRLRHFAKRAAGLIGFQDENDYFWIKTADESKKVFGLPVYPKRFAHLVQRPIVTRIISIGRPKLRQDKFENGEVFAEYLNQVVTLDAGLGKGVKADMEFFSDELNEWIQIVRVTRTRSFGIISRSLSKSGQEICWEDDSLREKERPCVPLRSGALARTLSKEFNL